MPDYLPPHRIDKAQRSLRVLALEALRLNPDGEELGAKIPAAHRLQIEISAGQGAGEIEIVVQNALRRVGVAVNHDGGLVNRFRVARVYGHWHSVKGSRMPRRSRGRRRSP